MALITCPSCGKQISPNASTCPGCGEPVKHKQRSAALIFYVLATLCFVGTLVVLPIMNAKEKISDQGAIVFLIISACVSFLLAVVGKIFSRAS